jgi:predicted HAD superfamily hydrolase
MRFGSFHGSISPRGWVRGALDAIVRDFGLQDHFCHVISTSDNQSRQKRSGFHLRRLLVEEALDPRQILSVGVAESDIAMARSCDVETVAVLSGNLTLEAAQRLVVKWILSSLAALPQLKLRRRGAFNSSASGRVKLNEIDTEKLPAPLQAMAQKAMIEKMADKRKELQEEVKALAEQRSRYMREKVAEVGNTLFQTDVMPNASLSQAFLNGQRLTR